MPYVNRSYDIIGDVAIMCLPERLRKHRAEVAAAIMNVHRNVKTVFCQVGSVKGDFRTRALEHLAGENKTVTVHAESGCKFLVDVKECYFSPRLSYEHMRVAEQVKKGEIVVNMFAGVGCFSILIAKYVEASRVYSIDINSTAVQFMRQNIRVNGVYGRVVPIIGDAKEVIKAGLFNSATRVLMPLPEKAFEYLPYALLTLKKGGGWIHYYDFEYAKKDVDAVKKVMCKVAEKLENLHVHYVFHFGRIVRSTGPHWYQVVLDIFIKS